jgi:hypothetical protein
MAKLEVFFWKKLSSTARNEAPRLLYTVTVVISSYVEFQHESNISMQVSGQRKQYSATLCAIVQSSEKSIHYTQQPSFLVRVFIRINSPGCLDKKKKT